MTEAEIDAGCAWAGRVLADVVARINAKRAAEEATEAVVAFDAVVARSPKTGNTSV